MSIYEQLLQITSYLAKYDWIVTESQTVKAKEALVLRLDDER